jgi:mannitol-1-phosphate/altronate dehydrogenase
MLNNNSNVSSDGSVEVDVPALIASYTMLAYPAFLAGYRTVSEAINDDLFHTYVRAFLNQDISTLAPLDVDPEDYKSQLLSRFLNPTVGDQLAMLCCDGASKLPAFVLPILLDLLEKKGDIHRITFLIAAYGHYLSAEADDKRVPYEVDEPHLHQEDWAKVNDGDVISLLGISPLATARLQTYSHFTAMYKSYRGQIAKHGVMFLLNQMAYKRPVMA